MGKSRKINRINIDLALIVAVAVAVAVARLTSKMGLDLPPFKFHGYGKLNSYDHFCFKRYI